jgi:cytochrome c oxidase assembly protein subunit 15
MVPVMTGGVFWEHLHRLVAGGLILLFAAAAWLTFRESPRFPWIRRASLLGLGLLLVQAALGGITVLFGLPDAVSTSHLGLAFLFLALATALAVATSPGWERAAAPALVSRGTLRTMALAAAAVALLQSLLGALVRHSDAGMACPDIPLCLGEWIPPFPHALVALHWSHRVLGLALLLLVLGLGHLVFRRAESPRVRALGAIAAAVALAQVLLGFLSVFFRLAPLAVSLHTLLAATLLALLVALSAYTWAPALSSRITSAEREPDTVEAVS